MTATSFPKSNPSIIVIGAGPIGLYAARVLASVGCAVRVIDDGRRGAGWASGGMLGAAYEILGDDTLPSAFKTFAHSSQWLWQKYLAEEDLTSSLASCFIARTLGDIPRFEALVAVAESFNTAITPISVPQGIMGIRAWSCPTDVALNPRVMLGHLRRDCKINGVAFVQGEAAHVETGKVTLSDGQIHHADHIVVATGQGGAALAHSMPELSNIALVKGQMMAIGGADVHLHDVVRAGRVYLIPRDGMIVVGATSSARDTTHHELNRDDHHALYHEALALCPALATGTIVESWAGMRPMTPDGLPLVGYSQIDGVILATGTYRNGWLLAPGVANAVMGLVLAGPDEAKNLQPFAPNRFPT